MEHVNTISLAPQCQRFSIFPVINISNNENFNEKNNIIIGSDLKSQPKNNNSSSGSKGGGYASKERPKIQILKNISTANTSENTSKNNSANASTTNLKSSINSTGSNLISTLSSSVTDNANSWAQSLTSSFFGWASPDITKRNQNKK
jgi:hypothetical protein